MKLSKYLNNKLISETTSKLNSLIFISLITSSFSGFLFILFFWLDYNIIYSFADGLITLVYLICSLFILHFGIMSITGLPVFFMLRLFKWVKHEYITHYSTELLGSFGIISYYFLLPRLYPIVKPWAIKPFNFSLAKKWTLLYLRINVDHTISTTICLLIILLLFFVSIVSLRKIKNPKSLNQALHYKASIFCLALAVTGVVLINSVFPKTHTFSYHHRDFSSLESRVEKARDSSASSSHHIKNIILITYDALRTDHLSFFGYSRRTSPFIDKIMTQSASFSNVTASYPQTSQSFASLFTGNYPWNHGVWTAGSVLPDSVVTVTEELTQQGYHTYAVVSNPNLDTVFNFQQGFEKYSSLKTTDPASTTDNALELVSEGLKEPFLFWVHYLDPHSPYDPHENYVKTFRNDSQYQQDLKPTNYIKSYNKSTPTAKEVADALARYDGEIRSQDEQFKRLFYNLQDRGYLDNSLLVFTSDHGEFFGHHGYYFNHGPSPYSELQVPLFWYCPGLIPPKRSDQPVELIDMVPTMLSLVGITPTGMRLAGTDLSDFITKEDGKVPFPRTYALGVSYWTYDKKGFPQFFILRSKEWELIINKLDHIKRVNSFKELINFSYSLYQFRGQGVELYNRLNDPFERKNLALEKPQIVNSMLKAMGERLHRHARPTTVEHIQLSRDDIDKTTLDRLKSLGYMQ